METLLLVLRYRADDDKDYTYHRVEIGVGDVKKLDNLDIRIYDKSILPDGDIPPYLTDSDSKPKMPHVGKDWRK